MIEIQLRFKHLELKLKLPTMLLYSVLLFINHL